MLSFRNPAANLTANRIPYASGGGLLADSLLSFDLANSLFLIDAPLRKTAGTGDLYLDGGTVASSSVVIRTRNGAGTLVNRLRVTDSDDFRFLSMGGGEVARINAANLLLGTSTDSANGRLQIATHTTAAAGYGFGDFSLYRSGAQLARLSAGLTVDGALVVSGAGGVQIAGPSYFGADIFLGSPGNVRWIYDYAGNRLLRERSPVAPTTLADVIGILQYHGLCS